MEPTKQNSSQPGYNARSRQFAADDFFEHPARIVDSTSSKKTENHYWCTVCENPNSYRDSGNWKKHEKGHETVFVCGLDHAVEDSSAGHPLSTKAFSSKRRDIMVNHLNKSHGIPTVQQGRELAEKSRISVKKQAWSCGFCVVLFSNFQERLKHIDIEHFRNNEPIQNWDFNKVIHGLMLQPKMQNAWNERTASLLPRVRPEDFVWPEAFAKNMRTKLEVGPLDGSDANGLAEAVYSVGKSRVSWNDSAIVPTTVIGIGTTGVKSMFPFNQGQAVAAQAFGYETDRKQSPSITRATAFHPKDSLFGRSPWHPYSNCSTTVPTMTPPDGDSLRDYTAPPFCPSQQYSDYDQAANETS